MKRKILCTLLIALLILGLVTPAAFAADEGGITPLSLPFTDVGNTWYRPYVQFVFERDIMGGTTATTFVPGGNLTRAQVAATLFRIEHGRPNIPSDPRDNPFTDVASGQWFAPYVTWAASRGIVTGASPTIFNPNNNATRQEFAVMLWRFAGEPTGAPANQLDSFTDRNRIASWAVEAMRWANQHGIVTGTAATINPTGTTNRAQAAAMLTRYIESTETDIRRALGMDYTITTRGGTVNNWIWHFLELDGQLDLGQFVGNSVDGIAANRGDVLVLISPSGNALLYITLGPWVENPSLNVFYQISVELTGTRLEELQQQRREAAFEEFLSHFDLDAVRELLGTDFEVSFIEDGWPAVRWRMLDLQGHVLDLDAFPSNAATGIGDTQTGDVRLILAGGVRGLEIDVGPAGPEWPENFRAVHWVPFS